MDHLYVKDTYWLPERLGSFQIDRTPFVKWPHLVPNLPPHFQGSLFLPPNLSYEKTLGSGAYGTVVLARHSVSGVPFACKLLDKRSLADDYCARIYSRKRPGSQLSLSEIDYLDRPAELSLREAFGFVCASTSSKGRRYVINLGGLHEDPAYICFLTEFMSGGSLSAHVASLGPHTRSVCRQLFEAVDYLHDKANFAHLLSLVHRDIKTDNILLSWHGASPVVKLADLGLSRSLDVDTNTTAMIGSPPTMPPEMTFRALSSHNPSILERSSVDIWSAGIVCLQLCAGRASITTTVVYGVLAQSRGHFEQWLASAMGFDEMTRGFFLAVLEPLPANRATARDLLDNQPFLQNC